MPATEALIAIAVCLAALVAVGVRIALNLKDISESLERLTNRFAPEGSPPFAPAGPGSGRDAKAAPEGTRPEPALPPEDAEIAAAIAAAARFVRPGRAGEATAAQGGERKMQ